MSKPRVMATREYVAEIANKLGIEVNDLAERIADLVVNEIEDYGRENAMLAFTEDGAGPVCSHCHSIAGFCDHLGTPNLLRVPKTLAWPGMSDNAVAINNERRLVVDQMEGDAP